MKAKLCSGGLGCSWSNASRFDCWLANTLDLSDILPSVGAEGRLQNLNTSVWPNLCASRDCFWLSSFCSSTSSGLLVLKQMATLNASMISKPSFQCFAYLQREVASFRWAWPYSFEGSHVLDRCWWGQPVCSYECVAKSSEYSASSPAHSIAAPFLQCRVLLDQKGPRGCAPNCGCWGLAFTVPWWSASELWLLLWDTDLVWADASASQAASSSPLVTWVCWPPASTAPFLSQAFLVEVLPSEWKTNFATVQFAGGIQRLKGKQSSTQPAALHALDLSASWPSAVLWSAASRSQSWRAPALTGA